MAYWSDYYKKPSCVYRLYDMDGGLLYVGMTTDPLRRIPSHRRRIWGSRIAYYTTEWHSDRERAKAAERAAIDQGDPLHNIVRPRAGCS